MFEIVMGIDDFLIQLVKYCKEIGYDHWRDLEIAVDRKTSANMETETFFDVLDLSYRRDLEIKTSGLIKDNELEQEKNKCIQLLIEALDKDLEESVHYLMLYRACLLYTSPSPRDGLLS